MAVINLRSQVLIAGVYFIILLGQKCYAQSFEQGQALFEKGLYKESLDAFQSARRAGDKSPQLLYNLGAVALKSGEINVAFQAFKQLQNFSSWRTIAQYYQAIIYKYQGDELRAMTLFEQVITEDSPIRSAALKHLQAMKYPTQQKNTQQPADPKMLFGWLFLGYGVDSNPVALSEDFQIDSSKLEDKHTDWMAYGHAYLTDDQTTSVSGYAFQSRHETYTGLDNFSAEIALHQIFNIGKHPLQMSVEYDYLAIDDSRVLNQQSVGLQYIVTQGGFSFTPLMEWSNINASENYTFLDGTQWRIGTQLKWASKTSEWMLNYQFEINDRENLSQGDVYNDFSPSRHRLDLGYKIGMEAWRILPELSVLQSQHDQPDTVVDTDGNWVTEFRQTTRTNVSLGIEYHFSKALMFYGSVEHINNDENIRLYQYKSNSAMVGMRLSL